MAFKTILACLTTPSVTTPVAAAALRLAERHDAHLDALHVIPQVPIYSFGAAEFPAEVIEREEQALQDRAKEVEKLFAKAAKVSSTQTRWRCVQSPQASPVPAFLQKARCADLIVTSQFPGNAADLEMSSEIVIGAGRPVLIIPNAGEWQELGTRAVVAWDGSREAARAAFDALPLLQLADSVHILTIETDSGYGDRAAPAAELALALSRHDIKTLEATSHPADISAGDDLLSRIADLSCDLLAMGCYGHTRLREFVFGGVTRHILKHMTVPVLMSH